MAEFVNDFQERSIPEYEQMRKYRIFTDEKIKGIIKSRENYQYKLSKNTKSLKDYGEYIIYEKKIHGMVVAVEDARKEIYPGLRTAMANRIVRLYKEAIRGFPDESRLWEAYLKFCKNNCKSEVPAAYERILQNQGENPLHWCNAAMYFHGQSNEEERVKSYFFRGLQRHPDNEMLHTAFFKVLLMDTADQPAGCQEAGLERVTALYNSAKKKVCNVHFLMNLLNILEDDNYVGFCKPLQKLIITDMMHLYPREEVVWDLLAQRELRGITMSEFLYDDIDSPTAMDTKDGVHKEPNVATKMQSEKKRIEICFSIYQTAVETLKTPLMWSMFINAMMELNRNPVTLNELKRKKLAYAFKGAQENSSLSEIHYHAYINLLIETNADKDFIIKVLNEAAENHNSSKLWEQHLSFYMRQGDEKKVYELFRGACIKLKDVNCAGMWDVVLQYYQTLYDEHYDKLLKLYKEAASRREPEFLPFRLQFLDFTIANHTICQARRLYADLTMIKPPYMELHKKMEAVEMKFLKQCSNPNPIHLRQVHENVVNCFGATRTDVWINYIKFEREYGQPKRSAELCERAKSTLMPKYVENFITEYCLLAVKK